jgi:hypothetical protein
VPSLLKVECYAGYKADQEPRRFSFPGAHHQSNSPLKPSAIRSTRTYQVTEVLDRWYGPDYECFRVRADDHNLYVLRHQLGQDSWSLDSFRRDVVPSDPSL